MIGNDRLYMAIVALATAESDARMRVCLAMSIIEPIRKSEFSKRPDLWKRLEVLKRDTTFIGPQKINGKILKDAYQNTASRRQNKTYTKYAKEIMEVWLETCK